MKLEGDLAKRFIETVKDHVGHNLTVVNYGETSEAPVNFSVECDQCHVVLVDADVEEEEEEV